MARTLGRREFLKAGAGLTAGLAVPVGALGASANATPKAKAGMERYKTSWYPFTDHPDADTCWSVSVGPDGRVYAAACAESVPGGVVKVVRYNEQKDGIDYLFSPDEMVNDPPDSGRATQRRRVAHPSRKRRVGSR
jgi:hypothetical protein